MLRNTAKSLSCEKAAWLGGVTQYEFSVSSSQAWMSADVCASALRVALFLPICYQMDGGAPETSRGEITLGPASISVLRPAEWLGSSSEWNSKGPDILLLSFNFSDSVVSGGLMKGNRSNFSSAHSSLPQHWSASVINTVEVDKHSPWSSKDGA